MRILIIGSGAREHSLAFTFHRQGNCVFCLPGNSGIRKIAKIIQDVDENNFEKLCEVAIDYSIDITVAASEKFLANGIADVFKKNNLKFFGPAKQAAIIESSKAFSKEFMKQENILTAKFAVADSIEEAKEKVIKIFKEGIGVVIKPDGLTAGKGVMVCDTLVEANLAIDLIMKDKYFVDAGNKIIIEERLIGKEISVMAFCDGKKAVMMIPSQDHKRLLDGSQGPNTGGMGAYAPYPFFDDKMRAYVQKNIFDKTINGLTQRGIKYVGVLYAGLIVVDNDIFVLEYNCRFGDPEAQAVLPLLKTDLYTTMEKCIQGDLNEKIIWEQGCSCCVVMASKGYPQSFQVGFEINGLDDSLDDVYIFHAGTKNGCNSSHITSGGRVLAISAIEKNLELAKQKAYAQIKKIKFEGSYYRKDIANEVLES